MLLANIVITDCGTGELIIVWLRNIHGPLIAGLTGGILVVRVIEELTSVSANAIWKNISIYISVFICICTYYTRYGAHNTNENRHAEYFRQPRRGVLSICSTDTRQQ